MDLTTGIMIGVFALLIVGMIFLQSRRRRQMVDQQSAMMDRLRAGMRIKTVAGVIGRIREIREEASGLKTILMETGHGASTSFQLIDVQAILNIMEEDRLVDGLGLSTQDQTPASAPVAPVVEVAPAPTPEGEANPMHEKYNAMKEEARVGREAELDAAEFVKKSNTTRKRTTKKQP